MSYFETCQMISYLVFTVELKKIEVKYVELEKIEYR